jgi:hypothetical protein
MKVVIVILAILAFIACLFLGLYFGGLTGMPAESTATITPSPITSTSEQHTIILFQVDDLTQASPHLVSIWLLFYYPDYPKLTMLLLYPPQEGHSSPKTRALGQQFALLSNGLLSPGFIAAVDSFGFKYNGYLITDSYSLTSWIDWLGGVKIGEDVNLSSGTSALKKLPPVGQDNNRIAWMKGVSSGVCAKLSQISVDSNWITLMNNITPTHFHTNLSIELLIGDWKQIKSIGDPITCELILPK